MTTKDHRTDQFTPEPVPDPLPDPKPKPAPPTAPARRAARDATIPATAVVRLLPSSAAIGDPSFSLHVIGSGFTPDSVIVFAGQDERTDFISDEELATGVNMELWHGADPAISCLVRTGAEESNTVLFAFTPPREVPLDPAHASQPIPLMDQITRV